MRKLTDRARPQRLKKRTDCWISSERHVSDCPSGFPFSYGIESHLQGHLLELWLGSEPINGQCDGITLDGKWSIRQPFDVIVSDQWMEVSECYVATDPDVCALQINWPLLIIATGCNLLKILVVFASQLGLGSRFKPAMSIGDVAKFFLSRSEGATEKTTFKRQVFRKTNAASEIETRAIPGASTAKQRGSLLSSTSKTLWAWIWTLILGCIIALLALGFTLDTSDLFQHFGPSPRQDIAGLFEGPSDIQSLDESPSNNFTVALEANMLQLVLSIVTVIVQDLLLSSAAILEWAEYASSTDGLRVSDPKGSQRSSPIMSLPFIWATMSMTTLTIAHWLVSESISVNHVQIFSFTSTDESDGPNHWSEIFFAASKTASFVTAIYLILGTTGLVLSLHFKGVPSSVPRIGNNSRMIEVVCQRARYEDADMVTKPLKWGVLRESGMNGLLRLGFSAVEVGEPISGQEYDLQRAAGAQEDQSEGKEHTPFIQTQGSSS